MKMRDIMYVLYILKVELFSSSFLILGNQIPFTNFGKRIILGRAQ